MASKNSTKSLITKKVVVSVPLSIFGGPVATRSLLRRLRRHRWEAADHEAWAAGRILEAWIALSLSASVGMRVGSVHGGGAGEVGFVACDMVSLPFVLHLEPRLEPQ